MPEPAIAPAPTLDVLVLDAAEPLVPEARARLDRGCGVVLVAGGPWHEDARRLAVETYEAQQALALAGSPAR